MPRLVGTDSSTPQVGSGQSVGQVVGADTSQAAFNTANQAIQSGYSALSQSLSQNSQTVSNTNQMSYAATERLTQRANNPNPSTGLSDGVSILGKVSETVLATLEHNRKQQAIKDKKAYEFAKGQATEQVVKMSASLRGLSRDDKAGLVGAERQFESFMNTTQLSGDDRAELYKSFYGTAGSVHEDVSRRVLDEQDKLRDIKSNTTLSQLTLQLSQPLTSLSNAGTPEEVNKQLSDIDVHLGKLAANPDLSVSQKAFVVNGLYKNISDRVFTSEEGRQKAQQKLVNFNEFNATMTSINDQEGKGLLSQQTAKVMRLQAADRYGISPSLADQYDPAAAIETHNRIESARKTTRELKEANDQYVFDGVPYDNLTIGAEAYRLSTDPAALAGFEKQNGKTVNGSKILGVVRETQKLRDLYTSYRKQVADINVVKALSEESNADAQLSLVRGLKPEQVQFALGEQAAQALGVAPADPQARKVWEEQFLKAFQDKVAAGGGVLQAKQSELLTIQTQIAESQKVLTQYGYTADGTFDQKRMGEVEAQVRDRQAKLQAAQQALRQSGSGGVTPSFRQPRLAKANLRGVDTFMPLPEGTRVTLTTGFDLTGGTEGRRHKGLDLATPSGTAVVSPMDGKVIQASMTGGGDRGGSIVEVEMDDGTSHVFYHSRAIKVTPGQRVSAGQVLAESGGDPGERGAGVSTGAHVHWEVYLKGSSTPVDPRTWGSRFNGNASIQRARSGDTKQTVVPSNSISGGINGRYTSSTPLRYNNSNDGKQASGSYGYKYLSSNPSDLSALNDVAKRLGTNPQWLADVIAHETDGTFDPSIKERGGSGATGIIQFYPDREGGSTKTIGGKIYNLDTLGRMNFKQQLGLLENYFKDVGAVGKLNSIEELAGAVYAGNTRAKGAYMDTYIRQVGRHAGRKYMSSLEDRTSRAMAKVDTKPKRGCTTCGEMIATGQFVPHERNMA